MSHVTIKKTTVLENNKLVKRFIVSNSFIFNSVIVNTSNEAKAIAQIEFNKNMAVLEPLVEADEIVNELMGYNGLPELV